MKKLLPTSLLLVVLVFILGGCCITRPSIESDNGNLKFGPLLSARTSSYWGKDAKDEIFDYKHICSFGFGGFAHYQFCEDYPEFGVLSGLYFNQYGAKQDFSGNGTDYKIKDRLSYLTLPFTFTYNVYDNFRVEAGPELSFLTGAKTITEFNNDKMISSGTEGLSGAQIGFNLGASYMHPETGLGGFIRYNGGLNKIGSSDVNEKFYNGGLSIGVRYTLNSLFK